MAYNPYMPNMPLYQQPYQMIQQQMQMNGGNNFVSVPNEQAARNYPIAPGNSVTFIDENSPYCYTKTMGLNQLDRPTFKRYRLVEEADSTQPPQNTQTAPQAGEAAGPSITIPEAVTADINALRALYEQLRADVEKIKENANGKPIISGPTGDK